MWRATTTPLSSGGCAVISRWGRCATRARDARRSLANHVVAAVTSLPLRCPRRTRNAQSADAGRQDAAHRPHDDAARHRRQARRRGLAHGCSSSTTSTRSGPSDGGAPSERTEVYLLYDDDSLYIGAQHVRQRAATGSRATSCATATRSARTIASRSSSTRSTRAATATASRRTRTACGTTCSTQNIGELQRDWTVIWETQSQSTRPGWTFEMAIPFKTLPFDPTIDTWGIQLRARHPPHAARKWSGCRATAPTTRASSGTRSGFGGMDQGVGLDVVPSLSVNQRRMFVRRRGRRERHDFEPSLDVFYRVTPSLNALADGQHRLLRDRGRRPAGQSHALQPVLSREARLLPERFRPVRVRPHRPRHERRPRARASRAERPAVLLAPHRA